MGKVIDMTGQRFGRLLVLERDYSKNLNHKAYWFCQCNCGKIVSVRGQDLRQGKTVSCGCYNNEKRSYQTTPDMIGQRFGKLVVLKREGSKRGHSAWLCQCDCGKQCIVTRDSLISGNTKSCGCLSSNGENIIANILDEHNINYKQQYVFDDLKGDKNVKLRFDFAIFENNKLKCLIEFQGEQHFIPFKNDTEETFSRRQRYDQKKRHYCTLNSIPLIEINYQDRMNIDWNFLSNLLKNT